MSWFSRFIAPLKAEPVYVVADFPTAEELVNRGTASLTAAKVNVTGDEFRRLMVRVEFFVPSPSANPKGYLEFWKSVFPAMALELIAERDK